jgi:hypothetical protein
MLPKKKSMLLLMSKLEEEAESFVQRKLITLVGASASAFTEGVLSASAIHVHQSHLFWIVSLLPLLGTGACTTVSSHLE